MIKVKDITGVLEALAPLSFQESYDNSGLQVGDPEMEVTGALVTLDVTEEVIGEAVRQGCNLVISHHPVIFGELKSLTGKSPVERIVARAIREGVALYSGHTNVDAVPEGVSRTMAGRLGLKELRILDPFTGRLRKLVVFVPVDHVEKVRSAMFRAGAGHIGGYDSCSFNLEGKGTFRGSEGTDPFVGEPGKLHEEAETRVETVVPLHRVRQVVRAMVEAHPYEEVAYDLYPLENEYPGAGMGMVGKLEPPVEEEAFLRLVRERFSTGVIRHTALLGRKVGKVALCGGAGAGLLGKAIRSGADVFITGDVRYHQFFDADGKILLMDIGHFESEQFTREVFYDVLMKNFPKFAVRLSEVETNPIKYF